MPSLGCLLILQGCVQDPRINEAKSVASAFAYAIIGRDTIAIDSLAIPTFAQAIRHDWPDTSDARLRFASKEHLVVRMAALTTGNVAVYVRAGPADRGSFVGILVSMTSSSPLKVTHYELVPDLDGR